MRLQESPEPNVGSLRSYDRNIPPHTVLQVVLSAEIAQLARAMSAGSGQWAVGSWQWAVGSCNLEASVTFPPEAVC